MDAIHKTISRQISNEKAIENIASSQQKIKTNWTAYLQIPKPKEEEELAKEIGKRIEESQGFMRKLMQALRQNDLETLKKLAVTELYPTIDAITHKMAELIKLQGENAKAMNMEAQVLYIKGRNLLIGCIVFFSLLVFALITIIGNSISRPLQQAVPVLKAISEEDLIQRWNLDSRDEIGQLALWFNRSIDGLGVGILKIKEIIGLMDITPMPQTPEFVKGVVNLRGKIIPVIDLRLKFRMSSKEYDEKTCIVVVEISTSGSQTTLIGIVVDSVYEVINISSKELFIH